MEYPTEEKAWLALFFSIEPIGSVTCLSIMAAKSLYYQFDRLMCTMMNILSVQSSPGLFPADPQSRPRRKARHAQLHSNHENDNETEIGIDFDSSSYVISRKKKRRRRSSRPFCCARRAKPGEST